MHDTDASSLEAPHEILGLEPHEHDRVRIVQAAARLLHAVHGSGGTQHDVRRAVAMVIRQARESMLRASRED